MGGRSSRTPVIEKPPQGDAVPLRTPVEVFAVYQREARSINRNMGPPEASESKRVASTTRVRALQEREGHV